MRVLISPALLLVLVQHSMSLDAPFRPRVEYSEGIALGIDERSPRFSWALPESSVRGEIQAAYHLVVHQRHTKSGFTYDSGRVASNKTTFVGLPKSLSALPFDSEFDWSVRWWSLSASDGSPSPFLNSSFSTGIGSGSWMVPWNDAQWIVAAKVRGEGSGTQIRKTFSLHSPATRAALYVAAIGWYQVSLDGLSVSSHVAGDQTNFEKRIWYTTYNVTHQLRSAGDHAIGFTLAQGWDSRRGAGKNGASILVRLSADLQSGDHVDIVSDTTWHSGAGPRGAGPTMHADVYMGETYNATMETPGWTSASYNESSSGK